MKGETSRWIVAIVAIVIFVSAITDARPGYIQCADSLECGKGSCCVLGMWLFPQCRISFGTEKHSFIINEISATYLQVKEDTAFLDVFH